MGKAKVSAAAMVVLLTMTSGAWAQAQAPVNELARAEQAVLEAAAADADQYAPELIALARAGLNQAQAASLDRRQRKEAPALALRAMADADLARALSRQATATAELNLRRQQVEELQQALASAQRSQAQEDAARRPAPVPVPELGFEPPAAQEDGLLESLQQRMAALRVDGELTHLAPYERFQAEQALAAVAEARRRERENALYIAKRRVETAEAAARAEAAVRQTAALDLTRNALLAEASRLEAERARRETERLRVQAQLQAEELERLRMAAEEEAVARQQAEQTLSTVAGQQTARLSAARQREARLAREEAELVAGAKLPASKFESRGEVFRLSGEALGQGGRLGASASGALSALSAYMQIGKSGRVRIEGQADTVMSARSYAEAVRDALVAGGVASDRLQVVGRTGAPAVTIIIAP